MVKLFITSVIASIVTAITFWIYYILEGRQNRSEDRHDEFIKDYLEVVDKMSQLTDDPRIKKLSGILNEFDTRCRTSEFSQSKGEVA